MLAQAAVVFMLEYSQSVFWLHIMKCN